ncbi:MULTISPECIES: TolB family protein [Pirellulaceae]|uniref:TolB family protein n=1 Tax=Pirellulaceae TaxID=2691357 RepID=UPI001304CD88|nr:MULTISPECIES: PD40 domain-containing protein [Pirellulaceae]
MSPADDEIVFNAMGKGGRDLYLFNLTTKKARRIASTPDYETAPSFSPDGQSIVYSSGVSGDRADHIFTIRRDGTAITQLTYEDANDTSPRFSPDGSTITFARDKTYQWGGLAANWEQGGVICLIDATGNNLRQLTSDDIFAFEPFFSNDGLHIVFSTPNGRMTIPVDGSSAPQAIPGPSGAVPSPDGKFIAYSKGKFEPDLRICITDPNEAAERELTPNIGGCYHPVFTHAGDRILFQRSEWPNGLTGGNVKFSVWQIDLDTGVTQILADRSLIDSPLTWKPQPKP